MNCNEVIEPMGMRPTNSMITAPRLVICGGGVPAISPNKRKRLLTPCLMLSLNWLATLPDHGNIEYYLAFKSLLESFLGNLGGLKVNSI